MVGIAAAIQTDSIDKVIEFRKSHIRLPMAPILSCCSPGQVTVPHRRLLPSSVFAFLIAVSPGGPPGERNVRMSSVRQSAIGTFAGIPRKCRA
jgi:hypothetical protein